MAEKLLQNDQSSDSIKDNWDNLILYFHYLVYNSTKPTEVSCCSMQESVGFAEYITDVSIMKPDMLEKHGYFAAPSTLRDIAKTYLLPSIICNGQSAILEYKKYSILIDETNWKVTLIIGLCSAVVFVIFLIAFAFYHKRMKLLRENGWLIKSTDIEIQQDQCVRGSVYSYASRPSIVTSAKKFKCQTAVWKSRESEIFLTATVMPVVPSWKTKTKLSVSTSIKEVSHPNLALVSGITELNKIPYIISQYCSKGTLNYFLSTCPYNLNVEIKYCFARDIVSGLKYLHQKNIIHGNLNSVNCYVDSTWNVKIVDWALLTMTENEGINNLVKFTEANIEDHNSFINLLYTAPETFESGKRTKLSDIYSYGVMLLEIFTVSLPFSNEVDLCLTSYKDIIMNKVYRRPSAELQLSSSDIPCNIKTLVAKLVGPEVGRSEASVIAKELQDTGKQTNKNVIDIMMKKVDKYVEDLEEKVMERTAELSQVTSRMKDLLHEMLPPQIASNFINGQAVEPEFYPCVTIFFSDIVGFTTISAKSTPYQVMALLNEMWKIFDDTIDKFDAYKVDTIGDAYMAASGIKLFFLS